MVTFPLEVFMVADVFAGVNPQDGFAYFGVRVEKGQEVIFLTKYPNCGEDDVRRLAHAMVDVMEGKKIHGFRLRRAVRINFEKPRELVFCAHTPFEHQLCHELKEHFVLLPPTPLHPTPVAPVLPGAH